MNKRIRRREVLGGGAAFVAWGCAAPSSLWAEEPAGVSSAPPAGEPDPRNLRSGRPIPTPYEDGYCDQPYTLITRQLALHHDHRTRPRGGSRPAYRLTTSTDQGRSWSPPVAIEPEDGPEASWAMPLVTRSGRVYIFYNVFTEYDVEKVEWQLLPEGDRGLRNSDYGEVHAERNLVALADGSLFCMYRTLTGHPFSAYSRDGARTWTTPLPATYTPGGRPMKTPRACPRIGRCANGKFLFWFHNHSEAGGGGWRGRNPAWLAGGVDRDGVIHWSQPEILLCDRGRLQPGRRHHLVALVDAGPRIIGFVVDGQLCDGSSDRTHGWTRYEGRLGDVHGGEQLRVAGAMGGRIESVRWYGRRLRTSEAIANFRPGG